MALCRACARGVSVKVNVPTRFLASSSGSGGIGAEAGPDKGTNAEQQQTTHFGFKRVPTALKQGGSLGDSSVCVLRWAVDDGPWPLSRSQLPLCTSSSVRSHLTLPHMIHSSHRVLWCVLEDTCCMWPFRLRPHALVPTHIMLTHPDNVGTWPRHLHLPRA
jgi:hypothetical protein